MRQTILAAAAALVLGSAGTAAVLQRADAQTPPPPAPATTLDQVTAPPAGPPRPMAGPMPMMHRMMMMRRWAERTRLQTLFFTPTDRHLTPADVQTIAEGFLLWHGNHDWKVTDVAQNSDGTIGFSLASKSGDVIARFSMDSHTGRVSRVG